MTTNKIGELNGKWSILFRGVLSALCFLLPFLIMLNVWFITTIHEIRVSQSRLEVQLENFIAAGPRYTRQMAEGDRAKFREEILDKISKEYPPDWFMKDVENLRKRIDALEAK